jgi:membrane protease YdiL (CAAX protease family)
VSEKPKRIGAGALIVFAGAYFGMTVLRHAGWLPPGMSLIPVIETAWLNFVVFLAAICWMKAREIPLSRYGLVPFELSRRLFLLVAGTMAIDTLLVGAAQPVLAGLFGESPQLDRFSALPGNASLLLLLLPLVWLIAAFGEEFFFRGFLLTAVAELFGGSRPAWALAVVIQAAAFGLVHAYQGPVQAIAIGIGGLVYGAAFLYAGRNLWPLILAHGINNTLGLSLLTAGVIER